MAKSFKTFLKHTAKDFHNQSVNPPVVRASTIIFKSMKHIRNTQKKSPKKSDWWSLRLWKTRNFNNLYFTKNFN